MLHSGRLAPERNVSLLIETAGVLARRSLIADYRFVIVGDGMLRRQLEEEARSLAPGYCTFLGHVANRGELARIYASADVFLHPNPAEPFGIAPLEAMASGLPLVGPASGGILTYANEANAWLTEAKPAALAAAIESVFAGSDQRSDRVATALAAARLFDWPVVTAQFLDLYQELHRRHDAASALEPNLTPDFESTRGNWLGFEG